MFSWVFYCSGDTDAKVQLRELQYFSWEVVIVHGGWLSYICTAGSMSLFRGDGCHILTKRLSFFMGMVVIYTAERLSLFRRDGCHISAGRLSLFMGDGCPISALKVAFLIDLGNYSIVGQLEKIIQVR